MNSATTNLSPPLQGQHGSLENNGTYIHLPGPKLEPVYSTIPDNQSGVSTETSSTINLIPNSTQPPVRPYYLRPRFMAIVISVVVVIGLLAATAAITWKVTSGQSAVVTQASTATIQNTATNTPTMVMSTMMTTQTTTTTTMTATINKTTNVSLLYFIEWSYTDGYVNVVSTDGRVQTRLSPTGGHNEGGVAVDGNTNQIFYVTNFQVWRADLSDVNGTKTKIWTDSAFPIGLTLSTRDQRLFIAVEYRGVMMLNYTGGFIQILNVPSLVHSYGLAVDQYLRTLYFTDRGLSLIYKANYSYSGFVGSASVILSGNGSTQTGDRPTGLVLDHDNLFWILEYGGEIRSMPVNGTLSSLVVEAGIGRHCYGLAKIGQTLYFTDTHKGDPGGVYAVTAGGRPTRITPNTTMDPVYITAVA